MNLILIKPDERSTSGDGAIIIDLSPNDERTQHLLNHLNKKNGDSVSIGFIDSYGGWKCKAIIQYCPNNNDNKNKNGIGVRLLPTSNEPSPSLKQSLSASLPQITLLLALPFPARLKYLWPVMASFTSVTRIIIVKSTLSNPEFLYSKAFHPTTYDPLIIKGMSQGGRTRPISVDICVNEEDDETISRSLLVRLGLVATNDGTSTNTTARIFFDCGADENDGTTPPPPPPARDLVLAQCCCERRTMSDTDDDANSTTTTAAAAAAAPSAILAIGPERGWTDNEANLFVNDCGFKSATLGSSILRVDTAVVSALSVVSAALEECQRMSNNNVAGDVDDRMKRKRSDSMERQRKELA
ncbi:hypothetical protein ACHAXH_002033 [Discostella pseudostelligera]